MLCFSSCPCLFPFKGKINTAKTVEALYVVSFHDVGHPIDLKENKKLVGKVRIVSKTSRGNSYNVQSKMNDKTLREFLMQEYGLNKHQMVVAIG